MKALKLTVIGIVLFLASGVQAQVAVNVNINSPPPWGPVGYSEVRYYYLPDVETYYDVQSSSFIYYSNGAWVHRTYLPAQYRSYDLYGGYKVVMTDYRGNTPYTLFTEHKTKYAKGYHGQLQKTIGEKPGKENHKLKTPAKDHSNHKISQGNGRSSEHSIDKNTKKSPGHGDGNSIK